MQVFKGLLAYSSVNLSQKSTFPPKPGKNPNPVCVLFSLSSPFWVFFES